MTKYGNSNAAQRNKLMIICIALGVVLALLIVMVVCLHLNQTPENDKTDGTTAGETSGIQELLLESVTEQGDAVLVVTTYGTVKYPYAFSDLLSVEAETFEKYAVLDFGATIDGTMHKLYKLMFNSEEGMLIGTLQKDGETYVVTAQFYEMSGVSGDSVITFNAAQETFNDVVNSLSENEGFTAVD